MLNWPGKIEPGSHLSRSPGKTSGWQKVKHENSYFFRNFGIPAFQPGYLSADFTLAPVH
jgi:hypothetical protein